MYSDQENISSAINLNENPAIPDTTGIGSALLNQNTAAPSVTIGALIVNGNSTTNKPKTVEEVMNDEFNDTSHYS